MSFIGKNIKKIRAVKKLSQAAFAELFSLARPSVGAYEEGRAEPKIDTVIAIANHFGLSTDALLRKELSVNELYSLDILKGEFDPTRMPPALGKSSKGTGPVQPTGAAAAGLDAASGQEINTAQPTAPGQEAGMPLVDREMTLEYIVNLGNRDFISKLPRIMLPQQNKGLRRAFVHRGQEMYYNDCGLRQGDVLLCNFINKNKLANLKPEKLYLLVTTRKFLVRRLIAANEHGLELKADNPAFENINLKAEEILEIWEAEGLWTRHLTAPAFLENKMLQLEGRLLNLEEKFNQLKGES
jgi:transcriptional regulator with XRE-family HTH domain